MVDVEYSYAREFAPQVPTKGSKEGPTIGPLNLDFSSGEVVFITGGNGSGKTTLVKLLASLYKPSAGYITLNGKRLGDESEEWYRQHFYAIFSEFCLIDELFRSLQSKSEIVMSSYLEKLRLPTKLMNSSGDVTFKELSSGQQARLALLPVYLIDKPVLIFDEWAAHQDPEFKRLFYHQLLPELKQRNKLIIVITHDDRYFESADRILRLDSGRVVEDFLNVNPLVGNSSQHF